MRLFTVHLAHVYLHSFMHKDKQSQVGTHIFALLFFYEEDNRRI